MTAGGVAEPFARVSLRRFASFASSLASASKLCFAAFRTPLAREALLSDQSRRFSSGSYLVFSMRTLVDLRDGTIDWVELSSALVQSPTPRTA